MSVMASACALVAEQVYWAVRQTSLDTLDPWFSVRWLVGGVALFYIARWWVTPLDRVRQLGSVGYIPEGSLSIRDTVASVQRRRLVGSVPPVYPNGWFMVLESRQLRRAQVVNVSCLGKNLAVYRSEDGGAHVLDAYCPHNGANLAVGGRVFGDCLECPFHGWRFRGDDGKCTHIPYCEPKYIPEAATVTSYPVLERNGFIYMWHHAEGSEPDWEPEEIKEISSGEWLYRGRTEHIVNAHIQEIPENGSDISHLPQVHSPIMTAGVDLRYMYNRLWSWAKHEWSGRWDAETEPGRKHIGVLRLTHKIRLFGVHLAFLDMNVVAEQIGPGIVHLQFNTPFGRGAYMHCLTPLEPLTQRIVHQVYMYKYAPPPIAKFFLLGEAMMIERDVMIWNNKKYASKPVYVKSAEDTMLSRHRRWYSQFYSEHSPRINPLKPEELNGIKNPLDW